MDFDLTGYVDRQIAEYCKEQWENYRCADNAPFNLVDFRNCYVFQVIKNAYYETEPKESLRTLRGSDDDASRMQDSRNMAYVQHYRNLWYQDILDKVGYSESELLPEDVKSMEGKIAGHKKTAMQYFEMDTIANYPLLKAITSRRICDVKKISNDTFRQYMAEYDNLVADLLKGLDGNDEEVIFSAIALFTLDWKYQIELFYNCAVYAEANNISEIPEETRKKISMLCADIQMPLFTEFPHMQMLHIQSRFVLNRMKLVPMIYDGSSWDEIEEKMYHYLAMNYVFDKNLVHHDYLYEFYARVSTRAQWADFIRKNYNIREMYKPKEWTNKGIRYVRSLYDKFIKDLPTP